MPLNIQNKDGDVLRRHAAVISDAQDAYTALNGSLDDADIVLIGEASHGTEEFYRVRAEITRHLIKEHDFDAVAVEADTKTDPGSGVGRPYSEKALSP